MSYNLGIVFNYIIIFIMLMFAMEKIDVVKKLNLVNILLMISFIVITVFFIVTPREVIVPVLFFLFIVVYLTAKIALNRTMSYLKTLELKIDTFDKHIIYSTTDLHGTITYANKAFCDISGYTLEELVGKPHNIVRHPDMPKEAFSKMWYDLKTKKHWRGEVKNKKKDGGFYWVEAIIEAEYDHNGNYIGYHAVRQDITSKKEVETLQKDMEKLNEHLEAQNDEKIIEVIELTKDIRDTQKEIIFTMGTIGEIRSKETGNHVKRVAEYTKLLALYSGMHEFDAEVLKQASPMHDIGKVGIPDAILNKPGRLTKDEMEVMKTHAQLGFNMLKHSDKKLLGVAALIAHQHHEKFDGTGYPHGLKGKNISIEGRITAIADVFDALGSERAYKKAWKDEDIYAMFIAEKGKHFDPDLIDIFLENKEDFLAIRDQCVDVI